MHNIFSKIKGHISVLVILDRLLGSVQWGHHQYLTVGPKSRHGIPTCRDTKTNAVLFFCICHFFKYIFLLFSPPPPSPPKKRPNFSKIIIFNGIPIPPKKKKMKSIAFESAFPMDPAFLQSKQNMADRDVWFCSAFNISYLRICRNRVSAHI